MEKKQWPVIDQMGRKELELVVAIFGDTLTPQELFRAYVRLGHIQKRSECDCGTTLCYSSMDVDKAHPFLYTKTATPCLHCYDEIVRRNACFIKSS
jgi:hypothetical protein